MKILILEDDEERIKFFTQLLSKDHTLFFARHVWEAKNIFEKEQPFDMMFLDHDLGGRAFVDPAEEDTGSGFARYLTKKDLSKTTVVTHTFNSEGARSIQSILKNVKYIPVNELFQGLKDGSIKIG